jgi:hypothetical protein
VDPRDETWEVELPRCRVYFWHAEARSDEYELSGAEDVAEVIRWAESDSDRRSFTAYACVHGDGIGPRAFARYRPNSVLTGSLLTAA